MVKKSLPEKVETNIVVTFLNETLDIQFKQFEARIDKKFDRIDKKFDHVDERFNEVNQRLDRVERNGEFIGTLVKNTHQEVKHFIELHKVLDERVGELERKVNRLEHLVEKLVH